MNVRHALIGLCVVVAVYGVFRAVSCTVQSDEARLREIVEELRVSFADRDLGDVLDCLTDDFEVSWDRQRAGRKELADRLKFLFFRGECLILAGSIERIEIEPDTAEALVVWRGKVRRKRVSGGWIGIAYEGTGELTFRRDDGTWLLARAEAYRGG